jgi:hypothetical protein
MPNQHAEDDINFWEGRQLNKFVKHLQIHEDPIDGHNGEEVVAATNTAPWPKHHDHESRPLPTVTIRAGSHYGRPSREAVRLSGQTLLRVQRNELKIANKI